MININDKLFRAIDGEELTNCIGTALFLVGEIDEERVVWDTEEIIRYLSRLKVLEKPEKGCIVSWEDKFSRCINPAHVGIVTNIDPLLVTSRAGIYREGVGNRPIIQDYPVEFIDEDIGPGLIRKYYKPREEISFD